MTPAHPARRWKVAALSVLTGLFVLVFPHLQPKQAFIAGLLLVLGYAVLISARRFLTLVVTALIIITATVGIVHLAVRA